MTVTRAPQPTLWSMICLLLFAVPAWSQDVSLADLSEARIEAKVVREQVIRRDTREFPIRIESDVKLVIGPGDKVHQTWTPTSTGPKGTAKGKTLTTTVPLARPREFGALGGGHGIFIFEDQTLTFLRTLKGGAFKRVIVFGRSKDGLTCTARETFAREDGDKPIFLDAVTDGKPMIIVSWKDISSTCLVAGGKRQAAQ
jgi:hypothetical protein